MSQINSSQALILKVLAKAPGGLSYEEIKAKVGEGVAVNSGTIGPVHLSVLSNYPDSLHALGLVKVDKGEGECTKFFATIKGVKLATKVSARHSCRNGSRIPPDKLDKAVLQVRPTKTYGLELFTDSDINEVKALLGEEWKHIKADEVRIQICNRRKQGAYANPEDKAKKAAQAALRAFGPEGKIKAKLLSPESVKALEKLAN